MSVSEPPVATADRGGATGRVGPDGAKSSAGRLSAPNKRPQESADDYPHVVVIVDARTRVIECADGIQWIIQKRRGKQWRGEMFFRTKAALLLYAPKPTASELLALPDYFPERTDDWTDWPPHQDERCTVQSARE